MSWHEERFEPNSRRLQKACEVCKRPMWLPPSKASKYRTCGGECAKALAGEGVLARTRPCLTCGTEFTPRAAQVKDGGGRYCSHRCAFDGGANAGLFAPETQQRALANRRAQIALHGPRRKTGPESPSWKGGPDATRSRRRDANNAYRRAYRKANPEWCRERRHARRAIKTARLPRGTVKRIGELQRWRCAVCSCDIRLRYHVDHIQALAKGGAHEPLNIQLLCPPCNVRKSAKDPIDFMQERGFLL